MDQFSTNKIPFQISDKLKFIKNYFIEQSHTPRKNKLKQYNTNSTFINRPTLRKLNKFSKEKQNIKSQLDQIGKEDSIFKNDKLITNIKLATLDDLSVYEILDETMRKNNNKSNNNNIKKYRSPNKNSKKCLTPFNKTTGKRNKKINYYKKEENNISSLTLDLNCNKMPQITKSSIKLNNSKYSKKKIKGKNNQRNLNLFINKPQNKNKKIDEYVQLNNILMTPIPTKNKRNKKIYTKGSFTIFNDSFDNTKDSICLTSISKTATKTYIKGKSVSINKKLTNMHFPNKSNIKNKDKILNELQKLFTDKITLTDDIYQKMTDLDKKNCITFLLESIKEMFTINKMTQSKNDDLKAINKTKEKQILNDKNEIKELKKDIIKLNKLVKTNILMNRKLSQKIDTLKIQLEKEKNKNKNKLNNEKRNITTENKIITKNKIRHRNKINGFIRTDSKKKFVNKSMEKIKNNNINIDENNYNCNKDTSIRNDEKINHSRNMNAITKNENKDTMEKNFENNINKNLLLEKNFVKEKKGLANNSDCTIFSDTNNGINE